MDEGPISFSVHGWTASQFQQSILRDVILTDPPPGLGIDDALAKESLPLLAVCDSGTWGLTGPTRADRDLSSVPGGRTDFVDFVRDTGRRLDKGYRGGTFGFGKAVLTQASTVSTVVIYSRTTVSGVATSRLIAMAVGDDEYHEATVRYTGRHWWGMLQADLAEPVQGVDADGVAAALGIHGLIKGATGTVILVVAPHAPSEDEPAGLDHIMRGVAGAAAEYAWPHMINGPGRTATIDFSFTLEGIPIPLHGPTVDARLAVFAEAYRQCQQLLKSDAEPVDTWPWHQRVLRSHKPACQLGALVWRHHGPIALSDQNAEVRSEVALIRSPQFVVRYLNVPRHPSGQSTYGVFIAEPNLDSAFAETEPPTHDDWIATPGKHFDPARRVRRQIAEELRPQLIASPQHGGGEEPGTVAIASALGGLLDGGGDPRRPWQSRPVVGRPGSSAGGGTAGGSGTTSNGHSPPGNGPVGGGSKTNKARNGARPTIRHDGPPRLAVVNGHHAVEFPVIISKPTGCGPVCVSAQAEVLIDGGRETEPPARAELPEILQWRDLTTGAITLGPKLVVAQDGTSRWAVVVSQPADTAVTVSFAAIMASRP